MINDKLINEWHPTLNDLTPYEVTPGSGKKVWWICNNGHEWEASLNTRTNGKKNCPYCSGQKVCLDNCLATINPLLAKEWHPTLNDLTPYEVTPGSGKKVWWICNNGHEWKTSSWERTNGTYCPYCTNRKVCLDNCLATINPVLAKEWHPTLNDLTPHEVTAGSEKKIWWVCIKGHEWETSVLLRTNGSSCLYCNGRKVCLDNCLATINPVLAKEWHPTKNGALTPYEVTSGTGKKVWWVCSKGHEWLATINSRNRGANCWKCCESKGEEKVKSILEKYNIPYDRQYRIPQCKNKRALPFDFYLSHLNVLIEYQGEQHEIVNPYWGGQVALIKIKNNDLIKSNFCKNNDIPLLIIWYYDFDRIEEIISDFLYK